MALVLLMAAAAQGQRSPFNGMDVRPARSAEHYRILIGGHFHGESTSRSGYPAATLLASLDAIDALGADLFLSTGDLYLDARKDSARYARALFSKLRVPFFNAPGNHDLGGVADADPARLIALQAADSTAPGGLRTLGHALILDTERDGGSLGDEAIRALQGLAGVKEPVFIVSHRPIWSEGDERYEDLFKDNTRSLTGTNYQRKAYPLVQGIAEHAPVYWISGSLGGGAPSSIFFEPHAPGITYIQCAIRDLPRDAILIADAGPDGVHWSALSLTGQELEAPEAYDAAWWRARAGKKEPFNWRLLPYLVKRTVLRPEFWYGAVAGLLAALGLGRLRLRR